MMTTFTMLMMLIALHLLPLLQQPPVVIVMVATVSHDQSHATKRSPCASLQVKKTFDDSFQAAQDPQTLKKYSSLKQTPENNWQGFKSWDRLVCLGLSASLPHECDQTE